MVALGSPSTISTVSNRIADPMAIRNLTIFYSNLYDIIGMRQNGFLSEKRVSITDGPLRISRRTCKTNYNNILKSVWYDSSDMDLWTPIFRRTFVSYLQCADRRQKSRGTRCSCRPLCSHGLRINGRGLCGDDDQRIWTRSRWQIGQLLFSTYRRIIIVDRMAKKNRAMHNDERVLIDSRQHVESDSGHARQWPTVAAVISVRFNRKRRVIIINY